MILLQKVPIPLTPKPSLSNKFINSLHQFISGDGSVLVLFTLIAGIFAVTTIIGTYQIEADKQFNELESKIDANQIETNKQFKALSNQITEINKRLSDY